MRRQIFIFVSVVCVLLLYTSYKLLSYTHQSYLLSLAFTVPVFFMMFANLFISRSRPHMTEKKWYQLFSGTGSILMGVWGSFIILSLTIDILRLVFLAIYNLVLSHFINADQVIAFFEMANLYLLPVACGIALFGFIEVLRGPVVRHAIVKRRSVTMDLNGFKIAQISDLHIGVTIRSSYVKKVVQKTNALDPDIIVITGDLIDAEIQSVQHIVRLLSKLKARYGVYYVTGNHEYYWGIDSIIKSLKNTGMHVLLNENKIISIQSSKVMVAGITDPAARGLARDQAPNLEQTASSSEKINFKILLAHQPGIYAAAARKSFDLQLSGHTHAGQFFPFNILVSFVHKYSRGLYLHEGLHVYVNSGTGYWGPANRFGIPAEITLLELGQDKIH